MVPKKAFFHIVKNYKKLISYTLLDAESPKDSKYAIKNGGWLFLISMRKPLKLAVEIACNFRQRSQVKNKKIKHNKKILVKKIKNKCKEIKFIDKKKGEGKGNGASRRHPRQPKVAGDDQVSSPCYMTRGQLWPPAQT